MRIGVTGATGFVGQYLIRDYGDAYEFVCPVRNVASIVKQNRNAKYIECDYSTDNLTYIFDGCDVVIHLAAKGMPKNRNPLRMEDYEPNIRICANVFESCKDAGIENVIFTSSRAVWGNHQENVVLKEDAAKSPTDEYGISKLCCETLADFYNNVYNMKIKGYRMAEVCGMDITRGMLNPFWAVLLKSCHEGQTIPIYGKGIGKRDLIYVKDVTNALIMGLTKGRKGFYNIGSGKLSTNKEIAEAFCRAFSNKSGIELYPEKEEWGTSSCLSISKAKNELGFEAQYLLEEVVRDIKKEYENKKQRDSENE